MLRVAEVMTGSTSHYCNVNVRNLEIAVANRGEPRATAAYDVNSWPVLCSLRSETDGVVDSIQSIMCIAKFLAFVSARTFW